MAVVIRKVWQHNLAEEFSLIQESLKKYRLASMDTEFPGTVYSFSKVPKQGYSSLSPAHHYSLMKENVNALKIIQLGLTLSDAHSHRVWEFNFCDFDSDSDPHDPASIALLRAQGIDFSKNRGRGIHSRAFAALFRASGLCSGRAWVTFHGLYDFGFLIKILTGRPLPDDLRDFMLLLRRYFGVQVYDLKPIARVLGLHGGLEKVAGSLRLERAAGKNHQAGSDSLLTMQAFVRLVVNTPCTTALLLRFNYMLYGLTCKF